MHKSSVVLGFGKPSLPRCQQPCMFDILSWGGQSICQDLQHSHAEEIQGIMQNENKFQQGRENPRGFITIQQKEVCSPYQRHRSPENSPLKIKNQQLRLIKNERSKDYQQKPRSPVLAIKSWENLPRQIDQSQLQKQPQSYPHTCVIHEKPIKHQLYSYQKRKLKRSYSQEFKKTKTTHSVTQYPLQKKPSNPSIKKLNQNDQNDRKIIEERKRRIKEFSTLTRDLPNSASATYFGKPVFEAYGRGNSCVQSKTYNVMPHKGDNHPKAQQCYESTLIKGRKVSQHCYIPRKPFQQCKQIDKSKARFSSRDNGSVPKTPINLPLEAPDLINHIRFSCVENSKPVVPVFKQLPHLMTKTKKLGRKIPSSKQPTKKKEKKSQTLLESTPNDGLKYMNKREGLLQLLQEKKTKDSKLAFKVTECYPLAWNCSKSCQTNPFNTDWSRVRPAGKPKAREDHVEDVFRGYQEDQEERLQIQQGQAWG